MKISEPVMLIGEGEYNLNALKEVKATDSYIGLGKEVTECQNDEPFFNCSTRQTIDAFLKECGCLPFAIQLSTKVKDLSTNQKIILYMSRYQFAILKMIWTVLTKSMLTPPTV